MKLLNHEELAEHLGVTPSWIREHSRTGREEIPVVRIGHYVRFELERVLQHLQAQRKDGEE